MSLAKSDLPSESLYNLRGKWRDMNGQAVSLSELRGRQVILAMAYTRCKASCPLTITKLKEIESAIRAKGINDVQIVMASFDPVHDTPEKLAEFFKARKLDPARWKLLSPVNDSAARELAAATGTVYSRDSDGEYSHSNVISLLNREGLLKSQIKGLDGSHKDLVNLVTTDKDDH